MNVFGLGLHLALLTARLQVFAQNATLSADGTPGVARALDRATAPTPGRLFFTPERRQALDQQRKTRQFQETVVEGDTLTLDGVVTRSSGKWTLWVNGSAVTEKDASTVGAAPVTDRPGQGRLRSGGEQSTSSTLSVGNGIDRNSGTESKLLGDGSIRVRER